MKKKKITIEIEVEGGCVQDVSVSGLPDGLDFEYIVNDLDVCDDEADEADE